MSGPSCERESAVLAAERTGRWSDDLERHLESCPQCADALIVERFLAGEAERARAATRLPTAHQIWWRADLRLHRELARKAQLPIRVLEKAAQLGAAAAAGVGFAWSLPHLLPWLARLTPSAASQPAISLSRSSGLWLALGTGVVLSLILVGLESLWTED